MEKQCIICNKKFEASREDAKCCSSKCRTKHFRRQLSNIELTKNSLVVLPKEGVYIDVIRRMVEVQNLKKDIDVKTKVLNLLSKIEAGF